MICQSGRIIYKAWPALNKPLVWGREKPGFFSKSCVAILFTFLKLLWDFVSRPHSSAFAVIKLDKCCLKATI